MNIQLIAEIKDKTVNSTVRKKERERDRVGELRQN